MKKKLVLWHLKTELKNLSYTWTLYPLLVSFVIFALKMEWMNADSEVPAPLDWLITSGLLNEDKTAMLMLLTLPIGFLVWLLVGIYKFTRKERARMRSFWLFIVKQMMNVVRILSGALFALWLLNFAPELGITHSFIKVVESAYFIFVAFTLSFVARKSVDLLVVQK